MSEQTDLSCSIEIVNAICIIIMADTGRKQTLFHCKWANSISHISRMLIEITPDFLCPFMND